MKKILILDDNLTICLMLKSWLTKKEYHVETATKVDEAIEKVKKEDFDLILSDIRMPDSDGFSFLSWIKKYDSDILVIMMTSFADIETAVEAIKSGAADYIAKPIDPEILYKKISDALMSFENRKKTVEIQQAFFRVEGVEFESIYAKMLEVIENNNYLFIFGEQGTGKTTAAKYIYKKNTEKTGPFVIFDINHSPMICEGGQRNCEQLLLENVEKAKGGTLFIKNFQKTDTRIQSVLVNLLKMKSNKGNSTQIIISSNEGKEHLMKELLPKLSQLLQASFIELPVLRGNNQAIKSYAEIFLRMACKELNKRVTKIDSEILNAFYNYPFEGNIQELKNLIFKACLMSNGNIISKDILPYLFSKFESDNKASIQKAENVDGLKKENFEKEKIIEALDIAQGNKTLAASILNIDRKTLYNKIRLYNVEVKN